MAVRYLIYNTETGIGEQIVLSVPSVENYVELPEKFDNVGQWDASYLIVDLETKIPDYNYAQYISQRKFAILGSGALVAQYEHVKIDEDTYYIANNFYSFTDDNLRDLEEYAIRTGEYILPCVTSNNRDLAYDKIVEYSTRYEFLDVVTKIIFLKVKHFIDIEKQCAELAQLKDINAINNFNFTFDYDELDIADVANYISEPGQEGLFYVKKV